MFNYKIYNTDSGDSYGIWSACFQSMDDYGFSHVPRDFVLHVTGDIYSKSLSEHSVEVQEEFEQDFLW